MVGMVFTDVIADVAIFLIIVLVLLVAFATLFYFNLSLALSDFESLPKSLYSVFRGLTGDMDMSGIFEAAPTIGDERVLTGS